MVCLRKSPAKGPSGIFQCDEEGCKYRAIQMAGCKVTHPDSSKDECRALLIKKIEGRANLIDKIEGRLTNYVNQHLDDLIHDLAIEIADELIRGKEKEL